jgi:hypothetical protein
VQLTCREKKFSFTSQKSFRKTVEISGNKYTVN